MAKQTRVRFSTEDDLGLLRQVLAENPFEDASRWRRIHEKLLETSGKSFSLRAVKDHLQNLLKLFINQDKANIKK